jgi:glycosyltransferase involved in cell wall biosynthesis
MTKVCHITTAHPVFDNRIFHKQCKTLANAGFEVYLIATHDKKETVDGVNIIPLPKSSSRMERMFKKKKLAYELALSVNADIYHFHDPELISLGIKLKREGKKVIYDVHEDVPNQILDKEWLGPKFVRKIVSKSFNIFEKNNAEKFDAVVTVIPEIEKKFYKNYRTIVVGNVPSLEVIDKSEPKTLENGKFNVICASGLTRIRGIKELIESIGLLKGEARLILLGAFDDKAFEDECRRLEGWKYTDYLGRVSVNEVYSYMKSSDLGMCTLHPAANYVVSWPTKAFEYMACGLPMIISDFPYWKSVFKDGATYVNPQDPNEIAENIKFYMENPDLISEIGNKNRKLIERVYSWEVEKLKLIELYNKLIG